MSDNIKKVSGILGIPIHIDSIFINPLILAEQHFFNEFKSVNDCIPYDQKAVKLCVDKRVSFSSTANSLYRMARSLIQLRCPICNEIMEDDSGSGNNDFQSVNYMCLKDGTKASIRLPNDDGISFDFEYTKIIDSTPKV